MPTEHSAYPIISFAPYMHASNPCISFFIETEKTTCNDGVSIASPQEAPWGLPSVPWRGRPRDLHPRQDHLPPPLGPRPHIVSHCGLWGGGRVLRLTPPSSLPRGRGVSCFDRTSQWSRDVSGVSAPTPSLGPTRTEVTTPRCVQRICCQYTIKVNFGRFKPTCLLPPPETSTAQLPPFAPFFHGVVRGDGLTANTTDQRLMVIGCTNRPHQGPP